MKKKITASEWNSQMRQRAERLVATGQMPSPEKLLEVIAETRQKYAKKIVEAR